jgi:hypothetical protein
MLNDLSDKNQQARNDGGSSGFAHERTHQFNHSKGDISGKTLQATDDGHFGHDRNDKYNASKAYLIRFQNSWLSGNSKGFRYATDYLMDEHFCYLLMMEADARIREVREAKVYFAARLKRIRREEQIHFNVGNKIYSSTETDIISRYATWQANVAEDSALATLANTKKAPQNTVPVVKDGIDLSLYTMPTDTVKMHWELATGQVLERHECSSVLASKMFIKAAVTSAINREVITSESELIEFVTAEGELARQHIKRVTGKYPENFRPELDIEDAKALLYEHKAKKLQLR